MANDHEVSILGPRRRTLQDPDAGDKDSGIRYVGVGARLTVFREALAYLRSHGDTFDRIVESVSTRPFAAHRIVGDRAVAIYMQTAEEVWRLEFPLPISWLGQYVLEPRWIRRMRNARVIAISASTAAALRRRGIHSEAIIPPGCDPPQVTRPRVAPSAAPRLLWIGRLVRTKLPGDAIAAFKRVRTVLPGATLDLVGGGYLEAEIQSQHHPGVTVHGFINEGAKASLLSRADLLLLPGTREGWGMVAMEAASYGVPVVAYDIPGLRDSILDGATGVLVRPRPDAMGAASANLLRETERWARISQAGQMRAQAFTWDHAARELLSILARRLKPRGGLPSIETGTATTPSTGRASLAPLDLLPGGPTLQQGSSQQHLSVTASVALARPMEKIASRSWTAPRGDRLHQLSRSTGSKIRSARGGPAIEAARG